MSGLSTFNEASSAVSRLDLAFDSSDLTERQRFAELRLFRQNKAAHVQAAVARSVRYFRRRPSVEELGQLIREEQAGRSDPADATPPEEVADRVAELRSLLDGDLVIRYRTANAVVVGVRDDEGVHDARWTLDVGWSCTCGDGADCRHVGAAKALVAEKELA